MPPRSTDGNPPSASFRPDCIQPELSVHLGGQTVTDARLHLGGAGTLWHNTLRRCPVPAWNIRNGDAAVKACLQLAGQGGGEGGVAGAVLGGGGPAAGLLLACRRLLRQRDRPVVRPPQLVQGPASFVCGVLPLFLGAWPPLPVLLPYAKSLLGGRRQLLFARPGALLKALQHLRVNLGQRSLVSGNIHDSCFDSENRLLYKCRSGAAVDRTEPLQVTQGWLRQGQATVRCAFATGGLLC